MPVHIRKRDGELVYRYWGNSGGGYYTPEMTLNQLVRWLIEYEVGRFVKDTGPRLDDSLDRAQRKGTSCMISAANELDTPWRESDAEEEEDLRVDDPEKYIDGTMVNLLSSSYIGDKEFRVDGKRVRVTVTVEMVEE